MAVSKRLRYEIFKRDQHKCRYCGNGPPDVVLTIDHVVPVSLGGSDDPTNLVTACRGCNGGKTSSNPDAPLVKSVSDDALRWAQAMRQAADEIAGHDDEIEDILEAVRDAWKPYYLPADWAASVVTFIKAGLCREDLLAMVRVAYSKRGIGRNRWAYFCGCCWTRIRQYQDRAAEILAEGSTAQPQSPALITIWTSEELQQVVASSERWADSRLDQDSIDSAHCPHRDTGDCGDPVCRAIRAESLSWMSYSAALQGDRATAVMNAADEAEDYVYG